MAPSRRRDASGKTSGSTTPSSSTQDRRSKEGQDKKNDNENYTAEDITREHDDIVLPESLDDKNTTSLVTTTEAGKKRKKETSSTSTASSSLNPSQEREVLAATTKLSPTDFCTIVPEEQHFKTVCNQRSVCEKMLYTRRRAFDPKNWEYNNGDFDEDDYKEACLHCHRIMRSPGSTRNVQVACNDCTGYICNDCHWCHEFQANHEIRVCDRCDAYYCRGCDEMDQCDDCGEVVCGSCSTLLSCKFCGGGLCEDCATACGR